MITIRIGTVLLLAALATAQNPSASKATESKIAEPELPVIAYGGGGAIVGSVQIVTKRSTIYDTWRENRKASGQLSEDERVHEFEGVCITRKPDRFIVRKANPDFTLKTGDVILQYQHWGEGKADIWANGGWHRDFDWGDTEYGKIFYTEKEGILWPVLTKWDLTLSSPASGNGGWELAEKTAQLAGSWCKGI